MTGIPKVDGRKLTNGAYIDVHDDTGKSIPLAPKSIFMAPKSMFMAPASVVDPTSVSMASAEQVMTLRGDDGGRVVEGSRVCCPDGIAEAVWDIPGNEGRNTFKYRAESAADPFVPVLDCFILVIVL